MIVAGCLFLFGAHSALVTLNHYFASRGETAYFFLLLPQPAIWWFLPGFGALTLSWEIVLIAMALVGREPEADSYNYWSSLKVAFDSRKLLRWFAVLIALPVGILPVLALPEHSTVRQNDITDCGYGLAGCRKYRHADARQDSFLTRFKRRRISRRWTHRRRTACVDLILAAC
jgi:hypothetical protein